MGPQTDEAQDKAQEMSDAERRASSRFDVAMQVEVVGPSGARAVGTTRNLSDGGVMLSVQLDPPPLEGDVLTATVTSSGDDVAPPVVRLRVTRVTRDGLALAFLA